MFRYSVKLFLRILTQSIVCTICSCLFICFFPLIVKQIKLKKKSVKFFLQNIKIGLKKQKKTSLFRSNKYSCQHCSLTRHFLIEKLFQIYVRYREKMFFLRSDQIQRIADVTLSAWRSFFRVTLFFRLGSVPLNVTSGQPLLRSKSMSSVTPEFLA